MKRILAFLLITTLLLTVAYSGTYAENEGDLLITTDPEIVTGAVGDIVKVNFYLYPNLPDDRLFDSIQGTLIYDAEMLTLGSINLKDESENLVSLMSSPKSKSPMWMPYEIDKGTVNFAFIDAYGTAEQGFWFQAEFRIEKEGASTFIFNGIRYSGIDKNDRKSKPLDFYINPVQVGGVATKGEEVPTDAVSDVTYAPLTPAVEVTPEPETPTPSPHNAGHTVPVTTALPAPTSLPSSSASSATPKPTKEPDRTTQPTSGTDTTAPGNTDQPTVTTQPTSGSDTTKPGNSDQPTATTQPTSGSDTTKPGNTDQPTATTQPTSGSDTTKPGNTDQPTSTTQPTSGSDTAKPGNTDQPTATTQPTSGTNTAAPTGTAQGNPTSKTTQNPGTTSQATVSPANTQNPTDTATEPAETEQPGSEETEPASSQSTEDPLNTADPVAEATMDTGKGVNTEEQTLAPITPEPQQEPKSSNTALTIAVIAGMAVVVLLAVLAIVLILIRKKRMDAEDDNE